MTVPFHLRLSEDAFAILERERRAQGNLSRRVMIEFALKHFDQCRYGSRKKKRDE
jgi:hypothetical protein